MKSNKKNGFDSKNQPLIPITKFSIDEILQTTLIKAKIKEMFLYKENKKNKQRKTRGKNEKQNGVSMQFISEVLEIHLDAKVVFN